jgi:transposase InsO family protein/ribosomal protein L19
MAEEEEEEGNLLERDRANRIRRFYATPGHPIAFSAPKTVAQHFGISEKQAKKILEYHDGYNLHREYKRPKRFNPYYVHSRREQVQCDLIDISRISAANDGIRFLLLLIDIFTKKVWVFPLKSKKAVEMEAVFQKWLDGLRTKPEIVKSDLGLEFKNHRVQRVLQEQGIEWQPAHGTLKAAIAERANKTIQVLIYKFLSTHETLRYIDKLDKLVQTYNRRPHRTLEGMTPATADLPANESLVQQIFHHRYQQLGRNRSVPKFAVGDTVRVKTDPHKISQNRRAYAEQFTGEYFKVVRINRTMPTPMFYLRSLDSGDVIEGAFYAEELQRQRGNVWKIERVLARRTRRGVRELKVKWKNFSDSHNSWIPETNIVQRF